MDDKKKSWTEQDMKKLSDAFHEFMRPKTPLAKFSHLFYAEVTLPFSKWKRRVIHPLLFRFARKHYLLQVVDNYDIVPVVRPRDDGKNTYVYSYSTYLEKMSNICIDNAEFLADFPCVLTTSPKEALIAQDRYRKAYKQMLHQQELDRKLEEAKWRKEHPKAD